MATLTVRNITRAGETPAYVAAAAGGDSFVVDPQETFFHVKNGGGASITVTLVTPGNVISNLAVGDLAVSVTNGQERMIGPLPAAYFADPADGMVDVSYSP